jgi:hypothetical protein
VQIKDCLTNVRGNTRRAELQQLKSATQHKYKTCLLERFKKFCGQLGRPGESGLFEFGLRFGSVTGRGTCSVAKASPELKNPRSNRPHNFLNRSSVTAGFAIVDREGFLGFKYTVTGFPAGWR